MGGEILLILFFVLIFFGADKIPEIARGLGKGLSEIKKATDEIKEEITNSTSGIRNEINDIRSDVDTSIQDARRNFDDVRTEIHSTSREVSLESSTMGTDGGLSIYEEIKRSEENLPPAADLSKKTPTNDNVDFAANI